MSDVARLEVELELARDAEELEKAREAMHEDRNEETIAAYKEAATRHQLLRSNYRENYRTVSEDPNDATPQPSTVELTIDAKLAGQ